MIKDQIVNKNLKFLSKLFRKAMGASPELSPETKTRFKKYNELKKKWKKDISNEKLRSDLHVEFCRIIGAPINLRKEFKDCMKEYYELSKKFKINPFVPIYNQ